MPNVKFKVKSFERKSTKVNIDESADIEISVITEVIDNPHSQFIAGDVFIHHIEGFLDLTGRQVKTNIKNAVDAFVANKYPDFIKPV